MTALTWLAVVVLGVGSLAVFAFFLRDVRSVLPNARRRSPSDSDHPAVRPPSLQ